MTPHPVLPAAATLALALAGGLMLLGATVRLVVFRLPAAWRLPSAGVALTVRPPTLHLWAVDRLGLHLRLWQLPGSSTTGLHLPAMNLHEADETVWVVDENAGAPGGYCYIYARCSSAGWSPAVPLRQSCQSGSGR